MKKIFLIVLLFGLAAAARAAVIKPGEIKIIPEYGRIVERFDGNSDKLIIHIQDAHTNYEAQKNSANIIEELINKYGLYLILVEGGSRDVSLNHYREQYTLERRKEIAEESLKDGIIAGEEYLNIISDYPMKLQGVEDRTLYDQNMTAFLDIDRGRENALLFTKVLSNAVSNLKPKLYNKALKELDEKRIGFKEEKTALNDYVEYLSGLARSKKINISAYRNYNDLVNSIGLEKAIDFTAVDMERADIIDIASKKIGQDDLNELLMKSVDFKSGKLTQAQYHNYIKDVMTKARLDINKYPNLEKYIRYVTFYEGINSTELFKELKSLEDALEQSLSANEDQRRLLRIAKDLELLIEFINLKLAPDDFDYYQKNEGNFDIPVWIRFLNSQSIRFKSTQAVPGGTQAIDKVVPALKNFYTIARKRDEVFLNNAKKYMNDEGVSIAVLIAGGFHTPTLMNLFRKENISYIVVSPKVLKPTDEKLYHKILTEGWAPAAERKVE